MFAAFAAAGIAVLWNLGEVTPLRVLGVIAIMVVAPYLAIHRSCGRYALPARAMPAWVKGRVTENPDGFTMRSVVVPSLAALTGILLGVVLVVDGPMSHGWFTVVVVTAMFIYGIVSFGGTSLSLTGARPGSSGEPGPTLTKKKGVLYRQRLVLTQDTVIELSAREVVISGQGGSSGAPETARVVSTLCDIRITVRSIMVHPETVIGIDLHSFAYRIQAVIPAAGNDSTPG